jgi:hypothetical protein
MSTQYRLVQSGKDCQRRLLSRPRFVRACSATDYYLCSSVTPWCVILFSTNSRPLVHPLVNCPSEPHQSRDFLVKCRLYCTIFSFNSVHPRNCSVCLNETLITVRGPTGKHLYGAMHIQNGLKQEDALSPLYFTFFFKLCHWEG